MILLVDDDGLARGSTAALLRARGLAVREAPCAAEALAVLQQAVPRVLVLDLVMPGFDGLALLHLLRDRPCLKPAAVAVVTALPDPLPPFPFPVEVWRKPLDPDELVARIAALAGPP